jgi:squalene/oxidosqualene cyclase-like protein
MVWCPMITAQYAIVRHAVGRPVDAAARAGLLRYFHAARAPDGAWGLHLESAGSVFVTSLVYVAVRLLGVEREEPIAKAARRWLGGQPGGVLAIPTWGKFWLALLDLYDWRGVNPCPPELFLLPRVLPFHPMRYYCHTRYIYLAMACLYGARVRASLGPITDELREELYAAPWASLNFVAHREDVAAADLYMRPHPVLRVAWGALRVLERIVPVSLRRRALDECFERIVYEQRVTNHHGLSPVNGLLNCVVLWSRAHPDLRASLEGLEDWRWDDAERGVRYAGARSTVWDTAFALRALTTTRARGPRTREAVRQGYAFLRGAQLGVELPGGGAQGRDPILGGWCFSDGAHRWPVSDCTAEALGALLETDARAEFAPPVSDRIDAERMGAARDFILARQNADGGFATYERRRGGAWLDRLNPSEMFGRCMTERSYVECTASALGALARLGATQPALADRRVDDAMARAASFLRSTQRPDGSVPGFWGVNFTYGIFHFVEGLRAAGVAAHDPALVRAAAWLVRHQRADGGWGEHYSGCRDDRYVEHPESQPVMTAWALLALLEVAGPQAPAVRSGIDWLIARQLADGGWPLGAVNGVFFGSAMLHYRLYPAYFPAWTLARYVSMSAAVTSSP